MNTIAQIMSRDVQSVAPEVSLRDAARLMRQLDVGSLPVCTRGELLGIVTDRDITIRGTAAGADPVRTAVSEVMTRSVEVCKDTDEAQQVLRLMGQAQVRRLLVVDARSALVGIVSLGDLATRQAAPVDEAVRDISSPLAVGASRGG